MKFEIQDKPAGVDKNGNLLWVITRQNTPAESNPDKERMQGLADLIAKLPVEEADKVINSLEVCLGHKTKTHTGSKESSTQDKKKNDKE